MFSKSLTTSPVDSKVKAFKYNFHSFESGTGESLRGHKTLTEVYIPSHKVCFNENGAFKSETSRAESENVAEVYLSMELVNNIVQCATLKAQLEEAQFSLIINQEYQEAICDNSVLNKNLF